MAFFGAIRDWWVRAQGGEVVRDFGLIDADEAGGLPREARAKLRRDGDLFCLQVDLSHWHTRRQKEFQTLQFFFRDPRTLCAVFEDVKRRVDAREFPAGEKLGPFITKLLHWTGKEVVHYYGAIDGCPADGAAKRVELALLQGGGGYMLFFVQRKQSYFEWPISLNGAILRIMPEVESAARGASIKRR